MMTFWFSLMISSFLGLLDSLFAIIVSKIFRWSKKTSILSISVCTALFFLCLAICIVNDQDTISPPIWILLVWVTEIFIVPVWIWRKIYRSSGLYATKVAEKEKMMEERRLHETKIILEKQNAAEQVRKERLALLDEEEHLRILEEEKRKVRKEKLKAERQEELARFREEIAKVRLNHTEYPDFSKMSGYDFEIFCAKLLRLKGYDHIDVTPKSGDFGADIIATDPDGKKVCFQCKNYQSPVGVKAVQEIIAAKAYYHCDEAAVITNSSYTDAARELAYETGALLLEVGGRKQRIISLTE